MDTSTLNKKVMSFSKRHQLIEKNTTILVGVSGGADSLLLLRFLVSLREKWQLHIVAITIDHGLRGTESREDVLYVEEICHKWNVPFVGKHINVNKRKEAYKEGTQLAARTLRYQVFEETMQQIDANFLALAHHGDDQVETVLMRMVRQSNPSSLKSIPVMRKFANGHIIRPFLCLSKEEIYQACKEYDLIPREDPSNQSSAYTRNFFRLRVLPLLKQQNVLVHQHVQKLTERLTEDEAYLLSKTNELLEDLVTFKEEIVYFDIEAFQSYPISLQRRAFHLILNYLYENMPTDLSIQHEEDFFNLLYQKRSNVSVDFPKSLKVAKVYQTMRFHFHSNIDNQWGNHQMVKVSGVTHLANGDRLEISYTSQAIRENDHTLLIPLECQSLFPLHVRVRQPGDRIKLRGLNGHKKVKNIFIDEKIPTYKRDTWPLLVGADSTLLWVVGLRKAELRIESKSRGYMLVTYQKQNNGRQ